MRTRELKHPPVLIPPPNAEVREWPTFSMYTDDEGIFYMISKAEPKRTIDQQKQIIQEIADYLPDHKICLLVDVTNAPPSSREVREYMMQEFPRFIKAAALVSRSALGKMAANLFYKVNSLPYPFKFFNNEKDAADWLRQYL